MTQSLARVAPRYTPTPIDTERLGAIFVQSGFFEGTKNDAQAITRILLGAEMGFGPVASMLGVYVVNGRPSASAQLIASAIQKSGIFRYRVREWTDTECRIEFFEGGESLGSSSFTLDDAKRAGLTGDKSMYGKYPRAMLWARAMSQGARAYTPSVFNGAIYTPEELGAEVDVEGRVIDMHTGEVLNEPSPFEPVNDQVPAEDRDLVRSVDDVAWTSWSRVHDRALELGLKLQEIRLGVERAALIAYKDQVISDIRERERQLEAASKR